MKYAIVTMIGMVVIMGCIALSCASPVAPETEPYQEIQYTEDIVVVIPEKTLVKGKYQRETDRPLRRWVKTGMPCDLYQGETDEQETVQEVVRETVSETVEVDSSRSSETYADTSEAAWDNTCPTTVETAPETQATQTVAQSSVTPQDKLLTALRNAGIEWWWPYAYAQVTQESRWNPLAENINGLDKGLFQYRIIYWTEPESIFDVDAQIRKYVSQVSARIAAGLSIEEIISRHLTSDYVTEINWEYVNLVLSHMN